MKNTKELKGEKPKENHYHPSINISNSSIGGAQIHWDNEVLANVSKALLNITELFKGTTIKIGPTVNQEYKDGNSEESTKLA